MKPKTFGQVFGESGLFLGAVIFICTVLLLALGEKAQLENKLGGWFVFSIFLVIVGSLLGAYRHQGETIVKESDDPKKMLQALVVRLAENGYTFETQTESIHTFKPPFYYWVAGRVYILSEEKILRIVGPTSVLEKLRDV